MSAPADLTKFWMVYGIGQRAPTRRHKSKANAQAEAKRLAGSVTGVTFVVLAAVDAYHADAPVVSAVKIEKPKPAEQLRPWGSATVRRDPDDDIPF